MNDFYDKVYDRVRLIPLGKVVTLGELAKACGDERFSRKVRRVLRGIRRDNKIPWHRVVDNNGQIIPMFSFGRQKEQKNLLINEGVDVIRGRVDLDKYAFYFW